ncbi:MAG TPA: glutamine-hydrolyzing GMP synthase [Vicinamibacterales bacterium]|nr:glutamine-hydrolyzing GMP synthase [Vicinamibacterales bacterium]
MTHQTLVVLDFGSQYTQLIARRLRELSVYAEIVPFNISINDLAARNPVGIILSGGPKSISDRDAPKCDPELFKMTVPTLGICYGMQAMTDALGGAVLPAPQREYGSAVVRPENERVMFRGLPDSFKVWASHGDLVATAPPGFSITATSKNAPVAAMEHADRGLYGLLFHPEVVHTEHGSDILENFAREICGCVGDWTMTSFVQETVEHIQEQVGESRVLCALSGGVDSTVVALLLHRAIGDRLTCIFVDNGVLRADEAAEVRQRFSEKLGLPVAFADASQLFLERLKGVTDPEEKRMIIGKAFIEVFETKAGELGPFKFLAQGTLYPDVIESVSVVGPSVPIKSHHNVGGLPIEMQFSLIEPVRQLFKDEVRQVGIELGVDEAFVWRQPFPGPGLAVRILGEVTPDRLRLLREADAIVTKEIREAGWYRKVWQSFPVLLPIRSVGVMGDERTYEYTVAIRVVQSLDGMTADWVPLPAELLSRMSSRIVNEVKGINRVVYDITSKPPSTIEWE